MKRPPRNFKPHPFAYHEEVELTIDDLTNLGVGVGRIDGWVIMVPYALPGERVIAKIWRNKSNYSEGDLVRVLRASDDRTTPVCELFGQCGGCQYQHLSYPAQLRWKTSQIEQLLQRLAGLKVPVNLCRGSAQTYAYRSKLTPHYEPHSDRQLLVGFQRSDSRSRIDVETCPIASDAINASLAVERIRLQATASQMRRGGTLLLRDSLDGVTTDNNAIVRERVADREFFFQAGEFFQNNPHVVTDLVHYALQQARVSGARYLVDAYCGVGVFGLCASDYFERVAGIEVNPKAIALAKRNAEHQQVYNVDFHAGEAQAIFASLTFPGESTAMIIDPPRKGCDEEFLRQLFAFNPLVVVYVSCGPDTQARDLKEFSKAGFAVQDVQPFDLFPQTRHIENIVTLYRNK
ncbi:MAG: class I SAM-dependent RNA methyltransferase [Verrucomicrobia bacterium]|nr:class I SAM-dependent RNA methyltransferase [Verrucomicrobiota bacterium]